MTELSALGIKITPEGVVKATQELTAFAKAANAAKAAAEGAGKSTANIGTAQQRNASSASKMAEAQQRAAMAYLSQERALNGAVAAEQRALLAKMRVEQQSRKNAAALEAEAAKYSSVSQAAGRAAQASDRAARSAQAAMNNMQATPGNIAAQFQDIGVTAAMGMSPLLIALQQGTQLSAAFAGGGLKQLGAAMRSVISPTSLLTIAIVAGVAALVQWGVEAWKAGDNTSKLEKAISDAAVVTSNFSSVQSALGDVFDLTTGKVKDQTAAMMALTKARLLVIRAQAMEDQYSNKKKLQELRGTNTVNLSTKGSAGTMGMSTGNIAGTTSASLVQRLTDSFSRGTIDAITFQNEIEKLASVGKLAQEELIKLSSASANLEFSTVNITQADEALKALKGEQGALGKFLNPSSGSAGGSSGYGDRLGEIMRGARADVAAEEMRAEAIGRTDRAMYQMEQRERILEELARAKIEITPKLSATVEALSSAYADARVNAANLEAVWRVMNDADRQSSAINDELALVGLYGDELIRARNELGMLAAARSNLPIGEDLTGDQVSQIMGGAGKVSSDEINKNRAQFMENMRRSAEDAAIADKRLRGEIGLTGSALAVYRQETELLNRARREGIEETPAVLEGIRATATAIGEAEYATQKLIERQQRATELMTNLFESVITGSKSAKQAVADLIIELAKMEARKAFASLIGNIFGSIGGGISASSLDPTSIGLPGFNTGIGSAVLANAKGGAYSGPGISAYSNSIVSKPTLFPFAKGTGLMGEAGAEAIMPLKRGPDGSLGVRASNDNSNSNIHVTVSVDDGGNFRALVRNEAGQVVAESAPNIVGQSVAATRKNYNKSRRGWI